MKTRETHRDRFHRFSKNRPVKFEIFKKLKLFEIKKIYKNLESISRFLVKIEFKNSN
jgi:hypothetical protein